MNLLQDTLDICEHYGIKPSRSKGQNFLVNEEVYDSIINSSDLKEDDVVLEVGPGLGYLTRKLAEKVKKVIAVELDDKLALLLKESLEKEGVSNVEVLNENILDLVPSVILSERQRVEGSREVEHQRDSSSEDGTQNDVNYKIVANLPYNITSVFLRKFLESENRPEMMVLMVQKEVAERIVAKPGKMSVLAVSVQCYAQAKIIQNVSKEDFWPSPKVDSAIIKIVTKTTSPRPSPCKGEGAKLGDETDHSYFPLLDKEGDQGGGLTHKDFFRLVKHGFSSKRKKLKNNLAGGYRISQEEAGNRLKEAGLSENVRAQELSIEDWKKLLILFK